MATPVFDLAAMGRAKGRRGRALMPKIEPPIGLARSILVQIRRVEHEAARGIRELILPAYDRKQLTDAAPSRLVLDVDETTYEAFRNLIRAMVRTASQQVTELIQLEGQRHTKQWMASARKAMSVDLSAVVSEGDIATYLEQAALRNASLITNVGDDIIKRVTQETTTALIQGRSATQLKDVLKQQLGFVDSRARLIAQDQTSKLTSDLNRIRHQQAGIESYIWRTSHDERVRPRHAALEGKQYKYGEPTGAEEGLPPGQPIRCRCVAQAIVEF